MANQDVDQDIQRLKNRIETILDWGKTSDWHSKMFEELSEKIFNETEVKLSASTLKRFFGVVRYEGAPSISTLDTLARFVGEDNWRAFKLSIPKTTPTKSRRPYQSFYLLAGFFLAIITISLLGTRRPPVIINTSAFKLSSKVLSREYPNSVVFDFKLPPGIESDSIKIQQYWDPSKTITVNKDQKQATGIYYFPGYFKASLLVDNQKVQGHDLFLKSDSWLGMLEYQPIPKYFTPIQQSASRLSLPEEIIAEIKAAEEPVVSSFHYINDLGNISGDSFTIKTRIQNHYADYWAVCQKLRIYIIGTDGAMIIPFAKIGCSSDNNLMLNDIYLNGKEHDLSALSADFSQPTDLEIQVQNKQLIVSINQRRVYEQSYNETMGNFVGVRYKFWGVAEVQDYQIFDQEGNLINF